MPKGVGGPRWSEAQTDEAGELERQTQRKAADKSRYNGSHKGHEEIV